MLISYKIPDCHYQSQPSLVRPLAPTPRHSLYLSNLDDQKFLRFFIKYVYLYKKSVNVETLKCSLSRVLVDYYPLAGRLRICAEDEEKLEIDCNGEGALFAEASMDFTTEEFLEASSLPNSSWRKLLYRVEARSFLDIPPLVIQVTYLNGGGMIMCTAINHCVCDGIGTSQFLQAWAHLTTKSDDPLPISPFHTRQMLRPRNPRNIKFTHPEYNANTNCTGTGIQTLEEFLQSQSQSLVPISVTFDHSKILNLKKRCMPSLKCTSFEALASHTWRSWIESLNPPPFLKIKLLFSVNIRNRLKPELPRGYYGNGFVLGCAETTVRELMEPTYPNIHHGVKLVQEAKAALTEEYVRSMIDYLEERRVKPDLSMSLVISQWAKLGLDDLDFGEGKPIHLGPLASEIYCIFLPVASEVDGIRVLMSVPESIAEKFEYYMKNFTATEQEEDQVRI